MNRSIAEKIEKIREMSIEELCKKHNCTPEEICVGDYIARNTKDTVCPYKVILGFANFENSQVESLGNLEVVYGKPLVDNNGLMHDINHNPIYLGVNFKYSKIKDLGNLRKVYGSITLNDLITSMGKVEYLGSNLYLNLTNIKDLGELRQVHGRLNLENMKSRLYSLGKLEKVGSIYCDVNTLMDMGKLTKVTYLTYGPNCTYMAIERINRSLDLAKEKELEI